MTRRGFLYRGMTQKEFQNTVEAEGIVWSSQDYSFSGEGTSFAEDANTAESYVNYCRDDPLKTGLPTYIVEIDPVGLDQISLDRRDGYYKASRAIPAESITRIFETRPYRRALYAYLIWDGKGTGGRLNWQFDLH